jgi:hypothetical protein
MQAAGMEVSPQLFRARYTYEDYPPEYEQYNSQYQGRKEVIGWAWYDTVTYTSGTTTAITLFNAIRATLDLSNMEVAGQLAAPKAFLGRALRFFVKGRPRSVARAASTNPNTGGIDNVAQLINTGVLSLNIGSKNYGKIPLWMLPAGGGAFGLIGVEGATADPGAAIDYGTNGIPDPRAVYSLSQPIFIAPQINWQVDLFWPAALTLAGGDHTISVVFDGDLIRPVQ